MEAMTCPHPHTMGKGPCYACLVARLEKAEARVKELEAEAAANIYIEGMVHQAEKDRDEAREVARKLWNLIPHRDQDDPHINCDRCDTVYHDAPSWLTASGTEEGGK